MTEPPGPEGSEPRGDAEPAGTGAGTGTGETDAPAPNDPPPSASAPKRRSRASTVPRAPNITVTADGPTHTDAGRGERRHTRDDPSRREEARGGTDGSDGAGGGGRKDTAPTATSVTDVYSVTSAIRAAAPTEEVLSDSDDGTSQRERVQRVSPDWAHFAPPVPRAPSPLSRLLTRAGATTAPVWRVLRHEWTLAILGGLALSLMMNRGALADPRHTLPQDVGDPALVTYLLAWGGHALLHGPTNLWHVNAFFPSPYGMAYTDSLLGYAPLGWIGTGPEAAVLRYNVVFILAQALAFVGAYALARQLGVGRIGGAVAGVAFAVAPWRHGQAGHLHVLSVGGIALALAMLARGHGIRWARTTEEPGEEPPPKKPGWAFAGWVVAAWQITIGFAIGLVFAYVLLGCVIALMLWAAIRRRRLPGPAMLYADGAGALLFAGVALMMAAPYLKVIELYPYAKRTVADVQFFSPPLRGFFTAPPGSLPWGRAHEGARALLNFRGETDLLPGFVLYGLAAAGLVFSVWSLRVRLALLAGAILSVVLGMGTRAPGGGRFSYLILLENLPGFEGLRTPGRLVIWTTLLLGLLAAGGVCALVRRVAAAAVARGLPRPPPLARVALLVPVALLVLEGLGTTPHAQVPAAPPTLSTVDAPYLVLPSDIIGDMHVMLWSTDRFAPVVNGGSGFVPQELFRTRQEVQAFPDQASVDYLRDLGVRTVVVLPDRAVGTQWQNAATVPIDGLGITRDIRPDAIVFHL